MKIKDIGIAYFNHLWNIALIISVLINQRHRVIHCGLLKSRLKQVGFDLLLE